MKKLMKTIMAASLAFAVVGAGSAVISTASADAVKDRKAAMKTISKNNKPIKAVAKSGDKAKAMAAAAAVVAAGEKFVTSFPKGTGRDKLGAKATRAKPEIWAKWGDFEAAATKMVVAAKKVAGGDMAAAGDVRKTCGGFHKPFRGPKAKK